MQHHVPLTDRPAAIMDYTACGRWSDAVACAEVEAVEAIEGCGLEVYDWTRPIIERCVIEAANDRNGDPGAVDPCTVSYYAAETADAIDRCMAYASACVDVPSARIIRDRYRYVANALDIAVSSDARAAERDYFEQVVACQLA